MVSAGRDASAIRIGVASKVALLLAGAAAALAGQSALAFQVTSNRPFAARCNGPMGAIVIREGVSVMSAEGRAAAVTAAVNNQHNVWTLQRAARPVRLLASRGAIRGPARVQFPRVAVHVTPDDRIILPDLVRAQQTGTPLGQETNQIRFTFQGFDAAQSAALRGYLQTALTVARRVYGPPAFDLDVTVINDKNVQDLQGGYYDVTTNEIHLAPLSGNVPEDTFVLIKLVLHAFHDDAIFFFDAWEEGFAGAAAMAVQTTPGVAPGYNPFDPGPFYCLSVYECENQPALGGPSFYPPSAFPGMLVWRLAMARAAWFKCYIEDPEFFRKFNAEYYRRYTPALAGDTFGLKEIAASVLPQVEGMSFYEWYNRQWVLDTSVQVGPKLFTWNIPLKESVALIVEYFSTSGSGAETPLGGQAMTIYWSYDFSVSLYAEEGNVISVPASGEGAGEGFLIPTFFNIGGPQRITVQIDIGNLRAYYPYPYGMRGFEPGENNIYGGIIDAIDGSVDISGGAEASGVTVSRGVWGKEILNGNLVPTQLTITYRTPDGQPASRTVNVGWDSYVVFLRGGGQVTVTHRFPAGVHLMSLPVYVLTPSAPQVLGVSEDQLLMARWYPRMSGTGAYRLWPDLEGFAPGKAFWLKLFSPLDVEVKGIPPDPNIDFPVTLQFGWNMVGVPRQGAISTSSLRFQLGTDPSVSFEEAVQRRWISDAVFGYTMSRGYEKADLLQPFRGYWMRSLITAELRVLFPPVAASQGRKKNASVPEANEALGIRIIGRSEDDAANVVIVHAADAGRAVQTDPSPPPGPAGLQLSISRTPSGILDTPSWRVSTPLVAGKWEVTLCGPPGARVSLYAEPLGGAKLAVALAAEGRQLPLGLRSAEVTVPLSGRLLLQLDVSHERPWSPAPLLTALAASATSQTACITYTLSRAASVEATVLNMAGRPVRRMVRVAETAGRHSISWNLTSDYGAPVPAGLYLVRLSASAPDGSYQQGVAPLRIVR